MATVEELLAGMSTPEEHIVVGSDRFITIPEKLKRIAVQFDHDIETVTFDCPRYWDDHDMSKMIIYINYARSDGYADAYKAQNVSVDNDIMHFDWTISRNVTEVAGQLEISVCVKNLDDDGNELNHWNSELCTDAYVSKGKEVVESIAGSYDPDIVTYLVKRMDAMVDEWLEARYINAEEASF